MAEYDRLGRVVREVEPDLQAPEAPVVEPYPPGRVGRVVVHDPPVRAVAGFYLLGKALVTVPLQHPEVAFQE